MTNFRQNRLRAVFRSNSIVLNSYEKKCIYPLRMLEARNIHKKFGDVEVLKGIDLIIPKASVVSIVGASGAGKTTLLQILGTLDAADRGELLYNDELISKLTSKQLAAFRNQHIGFIFQFHQLLPEFNALENVCLPGMIGGKPLDQIQKRAKELLDYLLMTSQQQLVVAPHRKGQKVCE